MHGRNHAKACWAWPRHRRDHHDATEDPGDPKWENDPAIKEYFAFMKQWAPGEPVAEPLAVLGYLSAQVLIDLLKKCGDELTRENLQHQVTHIKDY